MQLFLLDHIDLKGNNIIIDNPELWQQAKKVLRLESGDQIFIQVGNTRYDVEIAKLQDLKIFGTVKNSSSAPQNERNISMIIAMPNKREKAELIVQKLTEIGVHEIIFRPSERSVVKVWNENKVTRLEKIMKEALEQSRGRRLPKISFVKDIEKILEGKIIIVFDKNDSAPSSLCEPCLPAGRGNEAVDGLRRSARNDNKEAAFTTGLVGPEGGRGPKDYELFKTYDTEVRDLGSTILRMETAAIVGAWVMKNSL
ncbi:MAG: RsmE family RNA methyltransferase [candidate division SR1 bacterium]|nr:RsmE family RNA methyltransferase [candidate division SR1 bacterium]